MSVISQRQLLKPSIVLGALTLGLTGFCPSASAILIDFGNAANFPNGVGATSYNFTVNGVTGTISNLARIDPPPTLTGLNFFFNNPNPSNNDGLSLDGANEDQFQIIFTSSPVFITSYLIRSSNAANSFLSFNVSGGGSSPGNPGNAFTASDSLSGGQLFVPANTAVTITATFNGGKSPSYLAGLNVQAVPWETDVLPLVGATFLFGGGMWWKRRRQASQIDLTPTPDHGDQPTPQ